MNTQIQTNLSQTIKLVSNQDPSEKNMAKKTCTVKAILINDLETNYIKNLQFLKDLLDSNLPSVKIINLKIIANKDLVITVEESADLDTIKASHILKINNKIILDRTKISRFDAYCDQRVRLRDSK